MKRTGHDRAVQASSLASALVLLDAAERPGAADKKHRASTPVERASSVDLVAQARKDELAVPVPSTGLTFEQIYEAHFDFVWRSARRLGARDCTLDDVVQDTFLVVHRRLCDFERRSSVKTWLFGIVMRVVRDARRSQRRKPSSPLPEWPLEDVSEPGPQKTAERHEAVRVLQAILDELDEDKRIVFILSELEEMGAAEIAEVVGANVNTVYSRIRAARLDFEAALARQHARDGWRRT